MNNVALPEEIEKKLSTAEKDYFKNYSATLHSYIEEVDLDVTVVSNSLLTTLCLSLLSQVTNKKPCAC